MLAGVRGDRMIPNRGCKMPPLAPLELSGRWKLGKGPDRDSVQLYKCRFAAGKVAERECHYTHRMVLVER